MSALPTDYINQVENQPQPQAMVDPSRPDAMSKNAPSRKTRTEQRKLLQQTLMLGGAALVIGGVFLVIVVPSIIRFVGGVLGDAPLQTTTDTLPPQVPIISAPVSATNSASVAIKGYGESKSKVVVVLNGEKNTEQTIQDDGSFSIDLALTPGENNLSFYSVDEAKNESVASKSYVITFDNETPVLEVTEPQDGQQIELRKNQMTTIKGTTEPNARIYINGRMLLANSEGGFSTTYQLQEGENKLELKSVDRAGNETLKTITVQFRF